MLTIRDELRIRNTAHAIMQDAQRPFGARFLDCSQYLDKMVRDGECTREDAGIFLTDAENMAREELGMPDNEDYVILLSRHSNNGSCEYITRFYHKFDEALYDWDSVGDLNDDWTATWSVLENGTWQVIEFI